MLFAVLGVMASAGLAVIYWMCDTFFKERRRMAQPSPAPPKAGVAPGDLDQQVRRGEEAAALLRNPIYAEAWNSIRDVIVTQLEMADLAQERRQRLNDLLVAHKKAKQYMDRVIAEGKLAAQHIEQRSMTERIRSFASR